MRASPGDGHGAAVLKLGENTPNLALKWKARMDFVPAAQQSSMRSRHKVKGFSDAHSKWRGQRGGENLLGEQLGPAPTPVLPTAICALPWHHAHGRGGRSASDSRACGGGEALQPES